MSGFYHFDSEPIVEQPTIYKRVVDLTEEQRAGVYKGYACTAHISHIRQIFGVPEDITQYIYDEIETIQTNSRLYLRGEYLITPEVTDENGVTTAAVYAIAPTALSELKEIISAGLVDILPAQDVSIIIDMMISQSKYDGTGDWKFYSENIKL